MADIDALFFWMTGVITPSLWTAVSNSVCVEKQAAPNLFAISGFRKLCADFGIGKLGDLDFCEAITNQVSSGSSPVSLRLKMIEELSQLIPGVLEPIQNLKSHYQKWLVVDLPQAWFRQISQSLQLETIFPLERTIFLAESHLPQMIPDAFDYLPRQAGLDRKKCLLLDEDSRRSIQALNHGLPAAVIMNAQRLEKEFLLRKMTTQEFNMHLRPQ